MPARKQWYTKEALAILRKNLKPSIWDIVRKYTLGCVRVD